MAITHAQLPFPHTYSSAATQVVLRTSAFQAGEALWAITLQNSATANCTGVSDDINGSWGAPVVGPLRLAGGLGVNITLYGYRKVNSAVGGTPTAGTVTATWDAARTGVLMVGGVLGLGGGGALDKAFGNAFTGTFGGGPGSVSFGNSGTLGAANEAIVALMGASGSSGLTTFASPLVLDHGIDTFQFEKAARAIVATNAAFDLGNEGAGSLDVFGLAMTFMDAPVDAPITGPAAAPVSLSATASLAIAATLAFGGATLDAAPLAPLAINSTMGITASVSAANTDFEIQPPIVVGNGTNVTLGISATLQFLSGQSIAPVAPLAIQASLGITAAIGFSNVVQLPPTLSRARQYKVNPDEHLDAYAIQNQFVLVWEKDPDSVLDYSLDWSDWLAEIPDDAISSMSVALSSGLSVPAYGVVSGGLTAIMAAAGVVGVMEQATIHIVTDAGRVDERTIQLLIRQR